MSFAAAIEFSVSSEVLALVVIAFGAITGALAFYINATVGAIVRKATISINQLNGGSHLADVPHRLDGLERAVAGLETRLDKILIPRQAEIAESMFKHPSLTVLLIDDDPSTVNLVRRVLAQSSRISGVRAASRVESGSQQAGCDAVLLDLGLPETHGLDTLERARSVFPSLPIIVFTDVADPELEEKCSELADAFLSKEVLMNRMALDVIEQVVGDAVLRKLNPHAS